MRTTPPPFHFLTRTLRPALAFTLFALLGATLLLTACTLERASARTPTLSIPTQGNASGRPTVTISAPTNNSEVVVNQEVLVSVAASDSVGVSRVQLFANNQAVRTVSSESASGDRTLNPILNFTPRSTGQVVLQVIAYRGSIASDPAQVTVNVRAAAAQVTATVPSNPGVPVINPNDPTCRVLVNSGLNLREGPDTNYRVLTVLAAGTVVPVVGRTPSNQWYQVRVNTSTGWVSSAFVTLYGNCSGVPVVNPPVPPTLTVAPATITPIVIPTNTLTITPVPPTLTPTPGTPDLIISSINGPTTLTLGSGSLVTANFSIQITNSGSGAAGAFNNVIQVVPGTGETTLGVVSGLAAGQSTILTITLPFTTPGTYSIQARADSGSQVAEQSEVNNSGQTTVTVNP